MDLVKRISQVRQKSKKAKTTKSQKGISQVKAKRISTTASPAIIRNLMSKKTNADHKKEKNTFMNSYESSDIFYILSIEIRL